MTKSLKRHRKPSTIREASASALHRVRFRQSAIRILRSRKARWKSHRTSRRTGYRGMPAGRRAPYGKENGRYRSAGLSVRRRDEVVVLVSGLGATPVMELYVLYDEIDRLLQEKGIKTHKAYVGNYFTSLEMMGATLTIMKLDDELKELIDMPSNCMGLHQN